MTTTALEAQLRARLRAPGDPWDSARYRIPDPEASPAARLAWYEEFTRRVLAVATICDFQVEDAAAVADLALASRREFADA